MSVGLPATKSDIDNQAGRLALALRDDLGRIRLFKAWLDTQADGNLTGLTYSQAEVDTLRSAYGDLDELRAIYEGSTTLSVAKDFRTFAKLVTGVQ